jgi:integrase
MKLNERNVTATKPVMPPGKTDHIEFDDDISGFGLRIRASGKRYWIFQYARDGHTRRMTLGLVGKLSVRDAQALVSKIQAKLALGEDPAADKADALQHRDTLGEAVDRYLKVKAKVLKPRTLVETERYLTETASKLHGRPLAAISHRDVADILNDIADTSGDATANRFRANLAALYAWAITEGLVTANPVKATTKRAEKSRDRKLEDRELVTVWNGLPDSDYGNIVRLLILTGQRREEIGSLRWSEIDMEKNQIVLPESRTKNGKQHVIPMSKMVRDILDRQPRTFGRDFVFGLGQGFSGWSASKKALDASLPKMDSWRLHDLRRTMITGMVESPPDGLGIAPHVVEAIVNHQSGVKGGVAGVYNRANHIPERKQALELWAKHVAALVAAKGKIKAVA